MVAMKMRNKDGAHLGKVDMRAPELHLCSLATIHHEALATHLDELRGSTVLEGGKSAAAP